MSLVGVILTVWEAYVWFARVPAYVLPPPTTVWRAFVLHHNLILNSAIVTLIEMLAGLGLGLLLGAALAVPLVYSRSLREAVFPLLIALEGVPKLALAPVIVVWLGIGFTAKVALVALITFFPVVVQLSRGLRAVDEEIELFVRSLSAAEGKVFWKVRLPAALPFLLDALRLVLPLAMIGAVIGEFISSKQGLGHLLMTAVGNLNMALAFASLFTMGVIAASGSLLLIPIERRLLLWLPPQRR